MLLQELTGDSDSDSLAETAASQLSDDEQESIAGVVNLTMNKAAEALSLLIGRKARSEYPVVTETTWPELRESRVIPDDCLAITVRYTEGFQWDNLLVIRVHDAAVIADLMMGGDGKDVADEVDDFKMSAIAEAMNQMMGAAATAMSDSFGMRVTISTPLVQRVDIGMDQIDVVKRLGNEKIIMVKNRFSLELEEPINTEVYQIIPVPNALEIIAKAREHEPFRPERAAEKSPQVQQKAAAPHTPLLQEKKLHAQPVQFESFDAAEPVRQAPAPNRLDLLYDIPLQLTVELGRVEKTVKEILEISAGSIIGLDKLAGEPVDILVNGKLIARGEVIVIDENYGVRIKEIVNAEACLSGCQYRS